MIAPGHWTIGKMARFLELDIQDMAKMIRRKKLRAASLIHLWAKALNASDLSLELDQFRDHVVLFLKRYSQHLWGKRADPESLIQSFLRQIA